MRIQHNAGTMMINVKEELKNKKRMAVALLCFGMAAVGEHFDVLTHRGLLECRTRRGVDKGTLRSPHFLCAGESEVVAFSVVD